MRADDITGRLADEKDGCCGLLFGFAGGVLRGPGVDEGGDTGVEGDL
jgi:hypothetical protein